MRTTAIKDFYREMFGSYCEQLNHFLNEQGNDVGHFNVFDMKEVCRNHSKSNMPYNRRTYYKVSLIRGRNKVEYADKVVDITDQGILFATPKIPYRYTPQDSDQAGHFCIFTKDFLSKSKTGISAEQFPIFSGNSDFIYHLSSSQYKDIEDIFKKMHSEIGSDYAFKYDLLRNYLMELIHYGQKLKPLPSSDNSHNASNRIASLFIELLERQFPVESPDQSLRLKTPKDFADTLRVHVNHLNKVLKETTGKTTTHIIAGRVNEEARILLKQTTWNVSEIAQSLGFEELSHFSNFFKKHSQVSPLAFRN